MRREVGCNGSILQMCPDPAAVGVRHAGVSRLCCVLAPANWVLVITVLIHARIPTVILV